MSHHASGPNFGFPRGDARLDMTDLYAFPKPGDPGKSILILNVHPSIRLDSPEPTTKEPFAPGALYEIKIDTNGDAIADICYSVQFASSEHGQQTATVRRFQGARAAEFGDDGEVVVQGGRVSVGREAWVTEVGDFRFFFGWRSDPFFLDVIGNFNHMQFTGDDFFIDKNGEGWVQADRGARPLQAVFLVGEEREAYLTGEPANDDRFIGVFAHELEHTGGYTPEDARAVARKLLPDILSLVLRNDTYQYLRALRSSRYRFVWLRHFKSDVFNQRFARANHHYLANVFESLGAHLERVFASR